VLLPNLLCYPPAVLLAAGLGPKSTNCFIISGRDNQGDGITVCDKDREHAAPNGYEVRRTASSKCTCVWLSPSSALGSCMKAWQSMLLPATVLVQSVAIASSRLLVMSLAT
jgi:hypothetical protein